jgi:predicted patatin/cPLA2 family phospholipase
MAERHIHYNNTLDFIRRQEENGQALVIRPAKKSKVGRVEKDKERLKALYDEGYQDAESAYDRIHEYLEFCNYLN